MPNREKRLDAVKTMRTVRDRLSEKFQSMKLEEQLRSIRERVGSKGDRDKPKS